MGIIKNWKDFAGRHLSLVLLLVLYAVCCSYINAQAIDVDVPAIKWLSVNAYTGNVEISWEKSTTPEVKYYTVSYLTYTGANPRPSWVDVAINRIDAADEPFVSFNPSVNDIDIINSPVAFAIEAHIDDLTTSQVDLLPWDSTICLKVEFDTCLSVLNLSWNRYDFNMWDFGLLAYRIYISQNGAPYELHTTVFNIEKYTITNLQPDFNYSVYVAAIPNSPAPRSDSATSIVRTVNTFMAQIPQYIYADYGTYDGGRAEINFTIDPLSELKSFNLLRASSPTGVYDSITQLAPVNNVINFTDKVDYLSGPYYYKLDAINYCKQVIRSSINSASTIVLKNTGSKLLPVLTWNEYYEWMNGLKQFTLERKFGSEAYSTIAEQINTDFTDNEIQSLVETGVDATVCYRVTASEQDNPYGIDNTSISNEICYELPLNIRFEFDAFIPGSATDNNSFGPKIDFLPDEFIFEILDRSGRVVYRSENPEESRWDGRINGKLASEGAYMYVLQYRSDNNDKHVLRGGVVVVYP